MKNKRNKRLRSYVMWLFVICVCISFLIDDFVDFFLGFFAGWHQLNDVEAAKVQFGELSQIVGWVSLGIVLLVCVYCYRLLRKKVTQPIEALADNMREVSKGNLAVRASLNGSFEFEEIQETFNLMVEELENAKKAREMLENKNQQLYVGIAHDLKTPMTMIMGYAKVLEQDNDISQEDKKRYLKTIIEQTEHTNTLLDSLLAYTKLENRSYELKI